MRKLLLATLGFFVIQPALAQTVDSYLCIGDQSTGFSYDVATRSWRSTNFKIADSKYLLSKKAGKWQWKRFGSSYGSDCQGDFGENGFLRCDFIEKVTFNRQTLRYQLVYAMGYVVADAAKEGNGDTPFIEIGRCSPM